MSGFFDIPHKDRDKGFQETMDMIEKFLDDPENSKLNHSFGADEPTAVLQSGDHQLEENGETRLLEPEIPINWKTILIKFLIVVLAILIALLTVDIFVKN